MKKIIKSIGALALGAVVLATSSMSVMAGDKSYTYNYDYWGLRKLRSRPNDSAVYTFVTV